MLRGTEGNMSQTVDRLKELLFDGEAQALADLSRRIDGEVQVSTELARRIDSVADLDNRAREELRQKLNQIFDRVGTNERLTTNVAAVLQDALRQAEVTHHVELSTAIAPLVVTTIKTELRNSQDEMVEALYPITGRLVKSYVASAIKDLNEQINRRLEQNPIMLRLQSLTTGRSVSELAMAGTAGNFKAEELYLIRRGSGELVAHWPDKGGNGREQLMSGVLAAVNEFANQAFAADHQSLRQIDLGDAQVYLRGSPLYLLAAKCSGVAPKGVEQVLDEAFLAAVELQHEITSQPISRKDAAREQSALLAELGGHLESKIAEQTSDIASPGGGGGALKGIAALILLPIIGWFGFNWYTGHERARVEEAATRVVASTSAMQGYPTHFETSPLGRVITVSGLAPSQDTKAKVFDRLSRVLTGTEIRDQLAVVPGANSITVAAPAAAPQIVQNPNLAEEITGQITGKVAGQVGQVAGQVALVAEQIGKQNAELKRSVANLEAQMAFVSVKRSVERADRRLRQAIADLDRTAKATEEPERVIALKRITQGIEIVTRDLTATRSVLNSSETDAAKATGPLLDIAGRIEGLGGDVAKYMNGEALQGVPAKKAAKPAAETVATTTSLDSAAEGVAAEAERLAAMASTVALTNNVKAHIVAAAVPELGARERLETFARSHAIFFGNAIDYRNADAADKAMREIAPLIKDAGIMIRVVGYTDEAGAPGRNATVALERAKLVRQDLIARGVPDNLLAIAGRTKVADLGPNAGPNSPNRRVEFELSFVGEAQP